MVNYMLKIATDLENLTNLHLQGGCNDLSFSYLFKLKCGRCGGLSQKETCVNLGDTVPLPLRQGNHQSCSEVQVLYKGRNCNNDLGLGRPLTQEDCEEGKFAPLMLFCRGYEPVGFVFGGGWKVESLEGTKFEVVDLFGDEFTEYDEKGECPVMISNLCSTFDVVK